MHDTKVIITEQVVEEARELIQKLAGIHLTKSKDSSIRNRLDKLARLLNITDFMAFFKNVRSGNYRQEFINAFTTNKTDFFREEFHFSDMINRILPYALKAREPFEVYCCASSTGEEAYSIAATLLYAKKIFNSSTPVSVLATDIDTNVLEVAKKGRYIVDTALNPLPNWIDLEDYFSIEKLNYKTVKLEAKKNLKDIITFKQHNLYAANYPFNNCEFDIIFCRNVLIYFTVDDQNVILKKLFKTLKLDGTLYLGHSESILSLSPYVDRLGRNVFVKAREL